MATDYRKAAQSLLDGNLIDHGDLDTIASAAVHALLAIHDLLDDRLPEPEGVNAVEDGPTEITEEPPIGSQVTDRDGDVWEHVEDGWQMVDEDGRSGDSGTWSAACTYAPLRLTTDEDRERVGIAPADDGLAEWERELFRPATCCGKCPPIAGGGYDCTCEGNPHCEKADTPEEWHADTAPADVDPDEALAVVIDELVDKHGSTSEWADNEYITRSTALAIARVAREHIEAERKEGGYSTHPAERERKRRVEAEAERDEWQARYAALRDDVEGVVAYFEEHSSAGVPPRHVARRIKWNVLDRDDEWGAK